MWVCEPWVIIYVLLDIHFASLEYWQKCIKVYKKLSSTVFIAIRLMKEKNNNFWSEKNSFDFVISLTKLSVQPTR
jgi:hypothetical protein